MVFAELVAILATVVFPPTAAPSGPRVCDHAGIPLCYCGVNWVSQTCPELVDTSTWTGEPGIDGLIEKVMTAVPALSATMVNARVVVG
jgi:hypothetical protein